MLVEIALLGWCTCWDAQKNAWTSEQESVLLCAVGYTCWAISGSFSAGLHQPSTTRLCLAICLDSMPASRPTPHVERITEIPVRSLACCIQFHASVSGLQRATLWELPDEKTYQAFRLVAILGLTLPYFKHQNPLNTKSLNLSPE